MGNRLLPILQLAAIIWIGFVFWQIKDDWKQSYGQQHIRSINWQALRDRSF
ncbi:MAG: hypothetical protein WAP74_02250 [Patescibacteria group bacterium]